MANEQSSANGKVFFITYSPKADMQIWLIRYRMVR